MQTIGVKSPEKIQKITDETFNSFIAFAINTQNKTLEKAIYQLCCKTLSTEMIKHEFPHTTRQSSQLFDTEEGDTHRILSQVFQSVTTQIKNLK